MEESQFAQAGEKQYIPLFLIDANPWQTSHIDQTHVEALAHDIKEHGMMQSPTARVIDGRYQLAFGHHRLAGYRLLSSLGNEYYDNFPLYIHDLNDEQMAIAAFGENEKRRTLNPVDRARAVKKMLDDFGWTQELVAEKLHIDRSGVSNMLRMLRLPQDVLETVAAGELPVRSAMALIPIFEVTTSESVKLEDRFGESLADFLNGAKKGEVNSDVIRARVELYMNFLHPEQLKLPEIEDAAPAEPPAIQEEWPDPTFNPITETPENEFSEQTNIPSAHQAELSDWDGIQHEEAMNGSSEEIPAMATVQTESIDQGSGPDASHNEEREIQTAEPQPVENHAPAAPPAASTKVDAPDPNEILFNIAWKTHGVIVSYKKPGMVMPKIIYRENLRIDDVPAVMRELGMGK